MKQRNQKLKAIEKELNIKQVTRKAPMNKYSHVKGKLQSSLMKKSDQEFGKLVEELKLKLVQGEKQVIHISTQRDQASVQMPTQSNDLQSQVDGAQKQLAAISQKAAEINANLISDQTMFSESKNFIDKKLDDISKLGGECESLAHKNF